jgi:hypothetical protein
VTYAEDVDLPALDDRNEVLLRQVHPLLYLEDGKLSSVAFYPSVVDEGLLSTRRAHIGAQDAYEQWILTHESSGTWGISVGELLDESLESVDDSSLPNTPEGHASVDFTHLSSNAQARGPLYVPSEAATT